MDSYINRPTVKMKVLEACVVTPSILPLISVGGALQQPKQHVNKAEKADTTQYEIPKTHKGLMFPQTYRSFTRNMMPKTIYATRAPRNANPKQPPQQTRQQKLNKSPPLTAVKGSPTGAPSLGCSVMLLLTFASKSKKLSLKNSTFFDWLTHHQKWCVNQ